MAHNPWSIATLEELEARVDALLSRALGPGDLAEVCWALRIQSKVLDATFQALVQTAQENQTLRAILADQDDPSAWDLGDERW
jgi:hypothetical protein